MKLKAIFILLAACILVLVVGIQAGMAKTPSVGEGCVPPPTHTCTPRPEPTVTVTCTATPSPAPTVTVTCTPEPAPTVTVTCTPSPEPSPSCTADFHWWMDSCPLASCHLRNTGYAVVPLNTTYPHRIWIRLSSNISKMSLRLGPQWHRRWVRVKNGSSLVLRRPCSGYRFDYQKGRCDIAIFLTKPLQ